MSSATKVLPGFEHINRRWHNGWERFVAKIMPGEFYVTKQPELITTLLGSCIAVCMQDFRNQVGGMNHFKLPKPGREGDATDTNYGIYAMELLINEILKHGGERKNLQCAVFGGGNVVSVLKSDIGAKNIAFIEQFLKNESIKVVSKDVGHGAAQKVYFHPLSGKAYSIIEQDASMAEIKAAEQYYLSQIGTEATDTPTTFF